MESADEQVSQIDSGDVGAVRKEEYKKLVIVELGRELRDPPLDRRRDEHLLCLFRPPRGR